MYAAHTLPKKALNEPKRLDGVLEVYSYLYTVKTAFYDRALVQQKQVLNSRWSVKRGSLRQAHAKSTLSSPQN